MTELHMLVEYILARYRNIPTHVDHGPYETIVKEMMIIRQLKWNPDYNVRMDKALARFRELAESRTSDERVREQLGEVLERWFVFGREANRPATDPEPTQ